VHIPTAKLLEYENDGTVIRIVTSRHGVTYHNICLVKCLINAGFCRCGRWLFEGYIAFEYGNAGNFLTSCRTS